jgi:ferredoxin
MVSIDEDKCIGCGHCVQLCPNTFELEEGKAQVKNEQGDPAEKIQQAAAECPVNAITI